MPRGDKSSYTPKQRRQAQHIEESEKDRGRTSRRAAQIGWATVNKQDGGARGRVGRRAKAGGRSRATTRRRAATRPARGRGRTQRTSARSRSRSRTRSR